MAKLKKRRLVLTPMESEKQTCIVCRANLSNRKGYKVSAVNIKSSGKPHHIGYACDRCVENDARIFSRRYLYLLRKQRASLEEQIFFVEESSPLIEVGGR